MTKTYTLCHRPSPVEGAIRVVAGSFLLLSLASAWLFSPWARASPSVLWAGVTGWSSKRRRPPQLSKAAVGLL